MAYTLTFTNTAKRQLAQALAIETFLTNARHVVGPDEHGAITAMAVHDDAPGGLYDQLAVQLKLAKQHGVAPGKWIPAWDAREDDPPRAYVRLVDLLAPDDLAAIRERVALLKQRFTDRYYAQLPRSATVVKQGRKAEVVATS